MSVDISVLEIPATVAIFDFRRNDFSYMWSTSRPDSSYHIFKSTGLSVQNKKFKIGFQDGGCGGHLGFPIETILAIFDLQIAPTLPTRFQVSWPFGSRQEVQNRYSRWRPWRPAWISDRIDFSCFSSTNRPDSSYCFDSTGLSFQNKKFK